MKETSTMKVMGMVKFCNDDCFNQYLSNPDNIKGLAKTGRKIERAEHRAAKAAIKPKTKLEGEAQDAVNTYVRWRDYGLNCICCGQRINWTDPNTTYSPDAGHFRTRAAASQLRYNTLNIHAQRKTCNTKAFDIVEYERRLEAKIGRDLVEKLKNTNEVRRYSRDYLERIKRIFRKRGRFYKKRRLAGKLRPVKQP